MLKRKLSERPGYGSDDRDSRGEDDHHEKNPYKNRPPDFAKLAAKYPDLLGHFVRVSKTTGRGSLDFTDMKAAEALTKTLLLHDFGLSVEFLKGHLCPPLPNRINYLCWLSDLIDATESLSSGVNTAIKTKPIRVLDIGVGPVGIYPLLGHALFGWSFVGCDVDGDAIQHCQRNIDANPQLPGSVSLVHVSGSAELQERIAREYLPGLSSANSAGGAKDVSQPAQSLVDLLHIRDQRSNSSATKSCQDGSIVQAITSMESTVKADFVPSGVDESSGCAVMAPAQPIFHAIMCNPPFYDCDEKIQALERTVCTGSASEMRTTGGEVAFICAMIADSLQLRDRVVWYTSMVGKLSSLKTLKTVLAREGIPKHRIVSTTLKQGLTHRWCLAWTFLDSVAQAFERQVQMQRDRRCREQSAARGGGDGGDNNASAPSLTASFECSIEYSALRQTHLPSDAQLLCTAPYAALLGENELESGGSVDRCASASGDVWEIVERVVAAVHAGHTVVTQSNPALPSLSCLSGPASAHLNKSQNGRIVLSLRDIQCTCTDAAASGQVDTAVLIYDAWAVPSASTDTGNVERNASAQPGEGQGAVAAAEHDPHGAAAAGSENKRESRGQQAPAQHAYAVSYTVTTFAEAAPGGPAQPPGMGKIVTLYEYSGGRGEFGREDCLRDHEQFVQNVQRTNRRWRRQLAKLANNTDGASAFS